MQNISFIVDLTKEIAGCLAGAIGIRAKSKRAIPLVAWFVLTNLGCIWDIGDFVLNPPRSMAEGVGRVVSVVAGCLPLPKVPGISEERTRNFLPFAARAIAGIRCLQDMVTCALPKIVDKLSVPTCIVLHARMYFSVAM